MQKFSACKNRAWLIQRRRSTSSVCMMAIWPAGPPKEMNPSLSQNRKASAKLGGCTGVGFIIRKYFAFDELFTRSGCLPCEQQGGISVKRNYESNHHIISTGSRSGTLFAIR